MKRFLMCIAVLIVMGLFSVVSLAQDDATTTFDFENSDASITFPADWEQNVTDDGILELTTDGITMMVYDADVITAMLEAEDAESVEDILAAAVDSMSAEDIELNAEDAKVVELEDREVARLAFETDDATGAVIALPMDDETFGVVRFTISSDEADDLSPLVDEVVASFNTGGSESAGGSCLLSTSEANTAQIRVGPGANRTVIAFLPVNVEFEAVGQTTDDEGNIWFRIPKEQAAPTKSVNETWVAGSAVDQSGDCANVIDALAPPIIPIRQQQPTPVPPTDTGTTTTDTTTTTTTETTDTAAVDPFATDSSGAFILTQGQWFESRGNGNIRCGGITFDASPTQGTVIGELVGGSSTGITFGGLYYEYKGSNKYETTYYEDVRGGRVLLRETIVMTSANSGEGSIGGVAGNCTAFLPLTINYIGG